MLLKMLLNELLKFFVANLGHAVIFKDNNSVFIGNKDGWNPLDAIHARYFSLAVEDNRVGYACFIHEAAGLSL